ncbi:Kinesin-like protein KIF6 [Histomonas meleagridis]|uniref:Kinesin-like protein KIF6 n=1 Tax=Histomonas meleagridis TaxID=135588 RepID=UPI0035597417|nr:Kinesin-like protein KIF6 [Histomonas meleagridis]KAH0801352.1 Kinesin-like protein KIF6 [Histomonas meleagridis]
MTEDEKNKTDQNESKVSRKNSWAIQVVARVRPCFDEIADYQDFQPNELVENGIRIEVKPGTKLGWMTNPKPHYEYGFNKLFWKDSNQENIFNTVAKPLIDHALQGYNATLFAYGQTGSGKTYTLSGGDSFEDRGIIPRSISYIYQQVRESREFQYDIRVSYIEIYNSFIYDLLTSSVPSREKILEGLSKVRLHDSPQGIQMVIDGPKVSYPLVPCPNDETAFSNLFLGETNRAIAATASNDVSSRSHCIFTFYLEAKNVQTGELRTSKMNFVDLAGSERMDNLDSNDRVQEARFINQSLFYLHRVIEALRDHSDFIPYRDSKLTMILKDSLGGNCMTTMIATLSSKLNHIPETIATCKFARSVMTIKNNAVENISMDPKILIEKLRAEILRLRKELAVARGEEEDKPMTEEEKDQLKDAINDFMKGVSDLPTISPSKIPFCLEYVRDNGLGGGASKSEAPQIVGDKELRKAVSKLGKKLQSRENEISVLVNMLNQRKNRSVAWVQTNMDGNGGEAIETKPLDKKEAFKQFVQNHPRYRSIEQNTNLMKKKLIEAKSLAEEAHKLKNQASELKQTLKQRSEQLSDEELVSDAQMSELKSSISKCADSYMKICADMQARKREVETIKTMVESYKKQIKRDFASFWLGQTESSGSTVPEGARDEEVGVLIKSNEFEATGDALADEAMRRFRKSKELFMKKAEEVQRRQNANV